MADVDAAREISVERGFRGGRAEGGHHLAQGVREAVRGGPGRTLWGRSALGVVSEESAGGVGGAHAVLEGVVGAVDQGVAFRRAVDQPHVPGRPVVRAHRPGQHQAAGRRPVGVLGQPRLVHMPVHRD
ncbi:hypothetical protein ACN6LI_002875, partial [Streptomyces violaceoruber]